MPIARKLVGKRVKYLRTCDRTPRGSVFRTGIITDVLRNNIEIGGDYLHFSQIVSIEVIEKNIKK